MILIPWDISKEPRRDSSKESPWGLVKLTDLAFRLTWA